MTAVNTIRLIHLDTNFLIQAERGNTPAAYAVKEWLDNGFVLRASLIVWTEYLTGAHSASQVRHWQDVLDGLDGLTESQCQLAAQLQRLAGDGEARLLDCLIAAGAIEHAAALATINRRDFLRFSDHGLELAMDSLRRFPNGTDPCNP